MVVKPLPPELVERLKKIAEWGKNRGELGQKDSDQLLAQLENLDPRPAARWVEKDDTSSRGNRIRGADVSRNYPGTELVIKKMDMYGGQEAIDIVVNGVKGHNRKYPDAEYDLLTPKAEAISERLVAMSRVRFSVDGVESDELDSIPAIDLTTLAVGPKTNLARSKTLKVLEEQGITEDHVRRLQKDLDGRVKLEGTQKGNETLAATNILVAGVKKGRLQLVPALDIN